MSKILDIFSAPHAASEKMSSARKGCDDILVIMIFSRFAAIALLSLSSSLPAYADTIKLPQLEMRGRAVMGFNKERALEHCIAKGKRLPTVRELAIWAVSKGAQMQESPNKALAWPLEVDHMQRKGFDALYLHKGRSQTVVDFYFNPKGFKRAPAGNLGKARIWASDTVVVDNGSAYSFTPGWPTFRAENSKNIHAVICVDSQ